MLKLTTKAESSPPVSACAGYVVRCSAVLGIRVHTDIESMMWALEEFILSMLGVNIAVGARTAVRSAPWLDGHVPPPHPRRGQDGRRPPCWTPGALGSWQSKRKIAGNRTAAGELD